MLSHKSILVLLSLGSFQPKKTDKTVTSEIIAKHRAGSDAGKFVKNLLPDNAVEPIRRIDGEIRKFHYDNTLPWSDQGERILPTAHYDAYMAKMRGFRTEREGLVGKFVENYDSFVGIARQTLNGMFNQDDYPSASRVETKFRFKLDCSPVPDANDFRVEVGEAEIKEMQRSVTERIAEAEQNARNDLARRIAEPIATMVKRLSEPDAIFRDTLVTNLRDIVDLIPALNVTGDKELDKLRRSVTTELLRFEPETLRENKALRSQTAAKAQEILDTMGGFMQED